jgi:hypothetical protein
LVDSDEDEEQEEEPNDGQKKQPTTLATLGPVAKKFHVSKLLLPENHPGIAKDWLNLQISQLQRLLPSSAQHEMRILDSKGNDIPVLYYSTAYEGKSKNALKLRDFFKVASLVAKPKSVEIATSGPQEGGSDVNPTEKEAQKEVVLATIPKVAKVAMDGGEGEKTTAIDQARLEAIIQKAMAGRDHLAKDDFIYATQMEANLHWSEDEAEQTLRALIEEGKLIEEFEPGKYRLKPIGGGA